MKLYRIGDLAYPVFDGGGALRHSGRWHSAGRRVIYCGPNVSCCRLELKANLGKAVLRKAYGVVEIEAPERSPPELDTLLEPPDEPPLMPEPALVLELVPEPELPDEPELEPPELEVWA